MKFSLKQAGWDLQGNTKMWLIWRCPQLTTVPHRDAWVSTHLAFTPCIPGCAVSYTWAHSCRVTHVLSLLDVWQGLGNQRLEVDAVEEGDATASCAHCNQFHFQGQESLCLLDTKVCPSGNAKTMEFRAFMANSAHCAAVYSRSAFLSPTESLYLYIPAKFQTLHWTPWAFVPSLSQVHWAAAAGRPRAGQG